MPKSYQDLKQELKPIVNVNQTRRSQLTVIQRTSLQVTRTVGSVGFFVLVLVWTGGWFSWNAFAPLAYRFDPFPSFVLWLFISNVIQLLLLPLVMIGQNLESRHTELRSEADYEVNKKSEREIETILDHLEYQNKLLENISTKLP